MRQSVKVLSAFLIFLTGSPALHAQTEDYTIRDDVMGVAEGLRETAMNSDLAYDLVRSLTTEVGPRIAGSPADARAVAWAIAKFEELGFDRVWTEPVEVPVWIRGKAEAEVMAPFPQPLTITSLGKGASTPEGGVTAEIVHFPTYEDMIAADEESIRGKIVYISRRMTRTQDASGYRPVVIARGNGASEAAKRGALAIMIRSVGTDMTRAPHTGGVNYQDGVERIAAVALSTVDAEQLDRILDYGQPVSIHLDVQNEDAGTATSYNVIGEITGREQPDEFVLLGGHLDSWDEGTGAIDDATGVGATMAAGAFIASLPRRPRRSVRVMAVAAEEIGLVGARQYLEDNRDNAENHVLLAQSDLGDGKIYRYRPGVHPEDLPIMHAIYEAVKPLGILLGDNTGTGGSDFGYISQVGNMPALSLDHDTTRYFDLHHTPEDTFDKVHPENMQQISAAYVAIAYLMAEIPDRVRPKP